ncbi:Alpha-catulin [Nymphon striatum]|nr:Alpha-catulin [Nymphon striatum]
MAASTNALTEIITTLVNAKEKPIKSVKTLRAIVKVGQAVNNAVEKFVSVGEAFSNGNPEITADMYDACKEARSAGGAIQRLTEIQYDKSGQIVGACTDKSSMVIAARALLTSVTKVLILADTIVVKKLIVSKDKVAISLDRMENVTSFTDFVKAFSQFGSEMVELAHLTGDRQNDLKDERRRAQMSSARQILERSTMMLLTAFKYSSLSSARESSTLMTTDDGAMSSSSTSNNDGVVLLQRAPGGFMGTFSMLLYTLIVCLSTGMVAGKIVNCDNAFEVGCIAASDMTNGNFSDVKFKRNDKVKNIASMTNTVTIRNERVTINPAVLFSRITCILRDSSEMEVYLSYELAPQPPSHFLDGLMRKSPKSTLGQLFRPKAPLESCFPDDVMYIVDGGYLLRVVIWPANPTYSQVCDSYVSYTERLYGNEAIVVFGGYKCTTSTKSAEQKRRATKSSSRDIMFDESMQTVTTQSAFLSNDRNKTRLISMLVQKFKDKFIKTRQATADADRLIVETALSDKCSGQTCNNTTPSLLDVDDEDITLSSVVISVEDSPADDEDEY